jgi:hypothetical protein
LIRFSETFGAERVKTLLFEELVSDLLGALLEVAEFLSLDPGLFPRHFDLRRNSTQIARAPAVVSLLRRVPGREILHRLPQYEAIKNVLLYRRPPAADGRVEDRLGHLVAPEVSRLERLLKRDLAGLWSV